MLKKFCFILAIVLGITNAAMASPAKRTFNKKSAGPSCPKISCDNPFWTYQPSAPGQSSSMADDIAVDACDNVYFLRQDFEGQHSTLPTGISLTKLDRCGVVQWSYLISSFPDVDPRDFRNAVGSGIVADARGNVYITGNILHGDGLDAFIRKYNTAGVMLWTTYLKRWTTTSQVGKNYYPDDIALGNDGNVHMVGMLVDCAGVVDCSLPGSGNHSYWLSKYSATDGSSSGALWPKIIPAPDTGGITFPSGASSPSNVIMGNGVKVDSSGNDYVVGRRYVRYTIPPSRDIHSPIYSVFVAKFLADGSMATGFGSEGTATFDNVDADASGGAIAFDPSGHIYIGGAASGQWLNELNQTTGASLWSITSSDETADVNDISVDGSGNLYVVGNAGHLIAVSKYNASHTLLWRDYAGGGGAEDMQSIGIAVGSHGSVYVSGTRFASNTDPTDSSIWIRKYTPCGVSNDGPADQQFDPSCSP